MNRELEANTALSQYRIIEKIGAGGMGEVAPKFARFGILRLVRDLMSVSGKIEINARKGSIKRITLNRAAPLASGFLNALRALLLPEHVSIILDKI